RPGSYRSDVRSPVADGHSWDIEIQSAKPGELIDVEGFPADSLPPGLEVRLIDREQSSTVNPMRPSGAFEPYRIISFRPGRPYRLTILAGSAAYVSDAVNRALELPARAVLDPSAPNPSQGLARIRFGLPRAGKVSLGVYDVAGQRVASLVESV